ncbi:MAG: hypothetical protein ACTSWU_02795 [Candidatus Thorarchaeota archaeon]
MIDKSFTINGKTLDFYLNTKTWRYDIKLGYDQDSQIMQVTKAKGEAIMQFLTLLKESEE